MITIGIAAYREEKTIARAIEGIMNQKIAEPFEIIVATPDKETASVVRSLMKKNKHIKLIKEEKREGKPAAVNKILKVAKGKIIIFTDADVIVGEDAINKMLKHFNDKNIGLVSSHLLPINQPDNKFGFWAHLLYDQAHQIRKSNPFFASGNLFAIRNVIKKIPENALVDDFVIAKEIQKRGLNAVYEPEAKVYVKFPTNINDFLAQRRRTFAGYYQIKKWYSSFERTLSKEIKPFTLLPYCKKPIHYIWLIELAFYRILAWLLAFYDINIKKKSLIEIWKPIESSK